MTMRLPNTNSPEEVRRAFADLKKKGATLLDQGAVGEVIVGQGVGTAAAWKTELLALTKLVVDSITIDAAVISSDTGGISFADDNLTTSGTIAGVNVTSGSNPGHTHTESSVTGFIRQDGTIPLAAAWATGAYSIIGSEDWYMRADNKGVYFGAGDDASIYYNGSDMYINPQEVGAGDLHLAAGAFCIGRAGASATGAIDVSFTTSKTASSPIGVYSTVFYGSAGSGNMSETIYGGYLNAQSTAAYDGNLATMQGFRNVTIHKGSGTCTELIGSGFRVQADSTSGVVTNMYGSHIFCNKVTGSGGVTNIYGLFIDNVNDGGALNFSIYTKDGYVYHEDRVGIGFTDPDEMLEVDGNIHISDSMKMKFGTGKDATIYYNGTDLIVFPDEVGSGALRVHGDQYFSRAGVSGLPFAGIYGHEVSDTITISGTGIANKVQVTSFAANENSNQMTPDHTNDHITVVRTGKYLVTASVSISSVGGTAYVMDFACWKNNGATEFQNLHARRNLAGGGSDIGSMSISGIVTLAASDTLELWCYNSTNTNDVVVESLTLSAVQIGG